MKILWNVFLVGLIIAQLPVFGIKTQPCLLVFGIGNIENVRTALICIVQGLVSIVQVLQNEHVGNPQKQHC